MEEQAKPKRTRATKAEMAERRAAEGNQDQEAKAPQSRESRDRQQVEAARERRKRRRARIGDANYKLQAPERPGFSRRWVNDVPGRVDRFEENGWSVVQREDGGTDSRFVGKTGRAKEDGNTVGNAILMELPDEFYAEDRAHKEAKIIDPSDMTENQASRDGGAENPGKYIPGNRDQAARSEKLR